MLIHTLYGVMQSATVKDIALRRSLAPAEDERDEDKVLLTQVDLVGYIRVLGDDCLATGHDTYDSTISQLRIINPRVEQVTRALVLFIEWRKGGLWPPILVMATKWESLLPRMIR